MVRKKFLFSTDLDNPRIIAVGAFGPKLNPELVNPQLNRIAKIEQSRNLIHGLSTVDNNCRRCIPYCF